MSEATVDIAGFFEGELSIESIQKHADAAYSSAKELRRFAEALAEYRGKSGADGLRVAAGEYLLGRFGAALELFAKATDNKLRRFLAGACAAALSRHDEAIKQYQEAAKKGWDALEADMRCAAVYLRAGENDKAEALLKKHERAGADRDEWYVVKGMSLEARMEREAALEMYDKALRLNATHTEAMFRAGYLYDLRGDDDLAIALYEQLAEQPRASVNALINLSVMYEDLDRVEEAESCLSRVLAAFPNHPRAKLFHKDVLSSLEMVIDEGEKKASDRRNRLLETPIGEFELSVRARNCLKKMRIQTLGELVRLSDAELMSYKNFGETSLSEIRALLTKRGLKLGMRPEEIDVTALPEPPPPPPAPVVMVPPGSEAILSKPVSELELSVRSRRCLQRLNIGTVGDLIQHTEQDLLSTRNFGVTSLDEIKGRLGELGLSLPTSK